MERGINMKRILMLMFCLALLASCKRTEQTRGIPGPAEVAAKAPDSTRILDSMATALKEQGHQVFMYEEAGKKYLMQQYYLVFLKRGKNRNQDSTEAARLQKEHLAHLNRMAEEGFLSLAGPFGDSGDIRGIAVYNTPTQEMADSLAHLDPMVRAGRLEVEIHPWWAGKGGTLK